MVPEAVLAELGRRSWQEEIGWNAGKAREEVVTLSLTWSYSQSSPPRGVLSAAPAGASDLQTHQGGAGNSSRQGLQGPHADLGRNWVRVLSRLSFFSANSKEVYIRTRLV